VADFEAGTKSLSYAALAPGNEPSSPSLELLERVMTSRSYGVVVVEGAPRSAGAEALENDVDLGPGTAAVALAAAERKKVPLVGAEPGDDEIQRAVAAAGYAPRDLFGFHVLRRIPRWRSDGTLTKMKLADAFAGARAGLAARSGLGAAEAPDFAAFRRWYQDRLKKPFRLGDVRAATTEPRGELLPQKIAAIAGHVRSVHILKVTEEMLNRYGRVLLVLGGDHFPIQEPALEAMLGKPKRISDQP
jgi:hypothetical protein